MSLRIQPKNPGEVDPRPGSEDFGDFIKSCPEAAKVWLSALGVSNSIKNVLRKPASSASAGFAVKIPLPHVLEVPKYPSDAPDGFEETLAKTFEHVRVVFGGDDSEVEIRWATREAAPTWGTTPKQ